MESIVYKKLFELRILHEYYLSKDDDSEYFSLTELERNEILNKMLFYDRYDIWKDITIEPTQETLEILKNQHIRFVPQKMGFLLGIKVKPTITGAFFPFINLEENLAFKFNIRVKNLNFRNYTNQRLQNNFPAIFYFSNDNSENTKIFPSLSSPAEQFKSGKTYEAGEIAQFGTDVKQAIIKTTTNAAADWKIIDSIAISHEGEKIALPLQFSYGFEAGTNVLQADFTLKKTDGTLVKTISVTKTTPLDKVLLNFAPKSTEPEVKGLHLLEVSGSNGFQDTRRIFFSDNYNAADFAILEIKTSATNTDFNLLNPDGSIISVTPVYEIRIKSRNTYWRYFSSKGTSLAVTPKTSPYLISDGGALRSKLPIPMRGALYEFRDPDPTVPRVFLPNPSGFSLKPENDGRIYSDIYVSEIKDLVTEMP